MDSGWTWTLNSSYDGAGMNPAGRPDLNPITSSYDDSAFSRGKDRKPWGLMRMVCRIAPLHFAPAALDPIEE